MLFKIAQAYQRHIPHIHSTFSELSFQSETWRNRRETNLQLHMITQKMEKVENYMTGQTSCQKVKNHCLCK